MPLGNYVYSMDSTRFLICHSSHPSDPLPLYFERSSNARMRPDYSKTFIKSVIT
jgi:hypothetical protein